MGLNLVIVPPPSFDGLPNFRQRPEPVLVQAFIPHLAVEAFDESILQGLPRRDEVQLRALFISPDIQRLARELRPVVRPALWDPHRSRKRSSTRTTRAPGIKLSTSAAKHSRL